MKYTKEEHAKYKDCGGCKHWHEWSAERMIQKYGEHDSRTLCNGDCDKIPKGQTWEDEKYGTFSYDGYSIEDECYDEVFGCFEEYEG